MSGFQQPAQQVKADRQAREQLSFHSIACSDQLKEQLARSVPGNRAPVLLTGEEGAGKHYIARRLAAALLCDRPDQVSGACGICPSCRTLQSGSHFDLIEIEPPDKKSSIPVALVRSRVASTLHIYPQLSRNRVYVIDAAKAGTLNEQGQNALLKPLEEHPDFVRFIILTEDVDRLLPTIRSRSGVIRIGRRSGDEIRQILVETGLSDQRFPLALHYAGGLPGQALAIARDEGFHALRDRTFSVISRLPKATRTYCLTEALTLFREERKQLAVILRMVESFLRDMLVLQEGIARQGLVNADLAEALEHGCAEAPAADPAGAAELVRQTARALAANANFEHTLARMLLGIRAYLSGQGVTRGVFRTKEGFL